jgi:hypothetical protein
MEVFGERASLYSDCRVITRLINDNEDNSDSGSNSDSDSDNESVRYRQYL